MTPETFFEGFIITFILEKDNTVVWVRTCIKLYQGIQENLGFYIFAEFSLIQFIWIDSLFLALSLK